MNEYTTENLEIGTGVAFDWFGGKITVNLENLSDMQSDDAIRKIYFNFDGFVIRRVK